MSDAARDSAKMCSPTLELLRETFPGRRLTLDDWLSAAGFDGVYDGEIEVPEEFEREFVARCRLNKKW